MLSKTQTRILQNILDGTERSLAETAIQSVIREKLPRFLTEADANLRRDFFAQIEIIASEATGRKISTHPLRPSEVTKLVQTHKAEVRVQPRTFFRFERPFPAITNTVKRCDAASQEQSLEPNGWPPSL